jgi:HAD superfamily phosphoserine phosphatase-like hydrolase
MRSPPYRLVCFDVDGTLVGKTVFVWQTLHEQLGTDPVARKRAWEDFFAGRIAYAEWFECDIALFRQGGPVTRQRLLAAIASLELVPGAHEALTTLRDAGVLLAVVSGSLNIVLEKFDLVRHFDDVFVNELSFDAAGVLSSWRPTPFDLDNKAGALDWLTAKYQLGLAETAFVGDNFNDLSIARRAGLTLAFNSSCAELIDCAHANLPGHDLREILPHLLGR